MPDEITLTIDGQKISAKLGQTVIQAAMDAGIYVPYLCYWPGMKPYGACRMCAVEVEGQRGTPTSCTLPAADGMVVKTNTSVAQDLREGILDLLLSEHPHGCLTCHRIELCGPQDVCLRHVRVTDRCVVCPKNERCELKDTVRYVNVNLESPLSYHYRNLPVETKDPFYDRDYNLCIVCARCVRVCEEIRGDDAICLIDRSGTALVGTSRGTSLLESGCEFCGACVDLCPVGALVERDYKWEKSVREVNTTCPHCPVGCQVNLEVDSRNRVIRSLGDWSAEANSGQLCFKGKFGMEFVNRKERLTTPLIRRHGMLEEATWTEVMDVLLQRLPSYKNGEFSMLVTPRATNEEFYSAQKFTRSVMASNNIDVPCNGYPEQSLALKEIFGTIGSTGTVRDLENAGCALVVNSNITEENNVAAIPLKKGHKAGTLKLIVIDTREVELTRYADLWLRPYPGTESSLMAGILSAVVNNDLHDEEFLRKNCEGWGDFQRQISGVTLEEIENITGVTKDKILAVANVFSAEESSAILYGLDNVPKDQQRSLVQTLADLVLVTGNVGKEIGGLFPMRSGANEQGALDMGCTPEFLPGHVLVSDIEERQRFGQVWGSEIPSRPGLGINELFPAIQQHQVKALFVVGDHPAYDDDALHILPELELLIVQDLFISDLAAHADVVLPMPAFTEQYGSYTSLDRRIQMVRPVNNPSDGVLNLNQILSRLAAQMGNPKLDEDQDGRLREISNLVGIYRGISYEKLEKGNLQWPVLSNDESGSSYLFADGFGKRRALLTEPNVFPRPQVSLKEFPLLYAPGRVLAQPQREVEVIRSGRRNAISREEAIEIHPEDAKGLGINAGDPIEVVTPLQRVRGLARLTAPLKGVVNATFLFGGLASEIDQSGELDPMLKIPGLHVVPSRLEKIPN